jgi:predicted RND superfamily exporter protein
VNDPVGVTIRWPKTTVFVFVLLAVASVLGLSRLKEEDNLLVFLPTDDPDVQLFRDVAHRFGGMRVALIGAEAPAGADVFAPDAVTRLIRATEAVKNVTGVDRVLSLANVTDVTAGPAGAEVTQLVTAAPNDAAGARALRDKVLSREHIVGNLVSKDGRAALIMVFLAEGASDRQVTAALRKAANSTLAPLTVYFGGAPFAGSAIYDEAQADVWRLSPIALAVLLLVVVFSFRDPVGVVLTVCSVGYAVLIVLGGMGWWGERFTVASSTLPVILFASGSSYAVHVLGRYYLLREHHDARGAIRESLRIVGPPLLIAAGTTSVGFFSFVATDVRPMRAFGIACGAGVLICWLTSLTLVPAVVALWPRPSRPHRTVSLIGDGLVWLWGWARNHRVLVVLLTGVVALGVIRPASRVGVRMDPSAFFRPGSEPWRAERFLEERFGGAHFIQIDVKADLDDPASLREVERLVDFTRSLDGVTQVSAITQMLSLVNEVMGFGRRLPITRPQASNLYFFLEGEAGVSALLAPGRKEALLNVRLRGDPRPVVAELERYCASNIRVRPSLPSPDDVAERAGWLIKATTGRTPDPARLKNVLKLVEAPGPLDPIWSRRRAEVVKAFFAGEESPPITEAKKAELARLVDEGSPELEQAFVAAAPSPEEGRLGFAALRGHLDDERRTMAVERALPQVVEAAGLDGQHVDPALRSALAPVLDDRFLPPTATADPRVAVEARVAGEPILDRGFSRSVEHNQVRSLLISVVAVYVMLVLLFGSFVRSAVCMIPSLMTMAIIFGVMGLRGLHIDLGTSLIAGIATGAGSDFAMHYLWYLRRDPPDEVSRSVGPVMVVSIVLVSLGFIVLSLGRSPVMQLFGWLAGLSMSLAAFLTCLLVPAMLNKFGTAPGPNDSGGTRA